MIIHRKKSNIIKYNIRYEDGPAVALRALVLPLKDPCDLCHLLE